MVPPASGWLLFVLLLIALDLCAASIPAKMVEPKGRDFGSWYCLVLWFFPIPLIAAIVIQPNEEVRASEGAAGRRSKQMPPLCGDY
ncbi:MAG: hypothetical protein HYU46_18485 [Deltaproteobacteria bacterium]|nr:hypothetical protein [Deltaproteobacteria bacterium]